MLSPSSYEPLVIVSFGVMGEPVYFWSGMGWMVTASLSATLAWESKIAPFRLSVDLISSPSIHFCHLNVSPSSMQ